MLQLLTDLINQIFPPRPSEKVVSQWLQKDTVAAYSPGQYQGIVYLSSYQQATIQAVIKENKYHHNVAAAKILADLLTMWTKHQLANTLFVPIPLSKVRARQRGYNQVEVILNNLDSEYVIDSQVLIRPKHTKPQTSLSKDERRQNLQGAFLCNTFQADLSKLQNIVIVDDVVTTGATLQEARNTLAAEVPDHITITCLALAH